jgi:hypothetical protein
MFKYRPKFNKKDGETRICKKCGAQFHTMKPINSCKICINRTNKERLEEKIELGLIEKHEYKENYPFDTQNGDAVKRFHQIQYALRACKTKEERRAHFDKQLKEAEELGIIKWIFDRRDAETKAEKFNKRKSKINKENPDTRDIDWNEYERGGWGDIEDS